MKTRSLCFTGQNPANVGFMMLPDEAAHMLSRSEQPRRRRSVMVGFHVRLLRQGGPTRWIVDFAQRNMFEAMRYAEPWDWVLSRVKSDVLARAEKEKQDTGNVNPMTRMADRWWHPDYMPGTMAAISALPVTLRARELWASGFEFASSSIHPDNKLVVFAFADDYSFRNRAQRYAHWRWTRARGARSRRVSLHGKGTPVFDTFAWPQAPTREQIKAVAEAAVALRALRRNTMQKLSYSLRELTARWNNQATIPCATRMPDLTPQFAPPMECQLTRTRSLSCSNSISRALLVKKKRAKKSRRQDCRSR